MEEEWFDSIKEQVALLQQLAKQAADLLSVEVEALINEKESDVMRIERLLDTLLDIAFIPEGLEQYKRLCRYYYQLDPIATQEYVHAYRDMWDD